MWMRMRTNFRSGVAGKTRQALLNPLSQPGASQLQNGVLALTLIDTFPANLEDSFQIAPPPSLRSFPPRILPLH